MEHEHELHMSNIYSTHTRTLEIINNTVLDRVCVCESVNPSLTSPVFLFYRFDFLNGSDDHFFHFGNFLAKRALENFKVGFISLSFLNHPPVLLRKAKAIKLS